MNIKTIDLPAYWASALINNDYTGLDNDTLAECIAWQRDNPKVRILMCNNESYIGRYDGVMCDILTYSYTEGVMI
jgi:hypothetical protein